MHVAGGGSGYGIWGRQKAVSSSAGTSALAAPKSPGAPLAVLGKHALQAAARPLKSLRWPCTVPCWAPSAAGVLTILENLDRARAPQRRKQHAIEEFLEVLVVAIYTARRMSTMYGVVRTIQTYRPSVPYFTRVQTLEASAVPMNEEPTPPISTRPNWSDRRLSLKITQIHQ
ncbi:hypothetical protein BDZ91DRAFT_762550 [Kalaharituber pfeilii]|nr:hypothetical protein BDZ91DRAFT_762550 [Kalaharituber pfeilii]